jgi:hypothetical protein
MLLRFASTLIPVLLLTAPAAGGLHYSGETLAELPSQWRGFLTDQRTLRLLSVSTPASGTVLLMREQYQEALRKLDETARVRPLAADELADLGAVCLRLGKIDRAIETLRGAQRQYPENFRIAANLGTAWQMQGELAQAAEALREAVRLAPPRWREREEHHLRLVRSRQREKKGATALDDLFGVTYPGEPGKAPLPQRKKLPADAVAIAQQLALWLPADARLLWQLGELANLHGDVGTAANILDGCVSEFALGDPELRKRRQLYRAAANEIAMLPDDEHARYRGDIITKSPRPLERRFDLSRLPPIRIDGTNDLPWLVLSETTIDKPFRPRFVRYLDDLAGKRVTMSGFMQPLSMDGEVAGFLLIEYPIGCWFCESPEPVGMMFVTLPEGKVTAIRRGPVKVEGVLKLNRDDPEDFLYTIENARVAEPD